jgi:SAM-dependent methyltransferase
MNEKMIIQEGMSKYLEMDNYEKRRYTFIASFFCDIKGKILDVGCGKGNLKKYLSPYLEYYGVDLLEQKFNGYFRVNLNHPILPFRSKIFDAINCSAVLEHIFFPLELLKEMKRILRDDGIILISLPNDKGLSAIYSQLFVPIDNYEDYIYGHHWKFSIRTARKFFEKEFKIIKEAPGFGPLFEKYLFFLKFKNLCTEWFMLGIKK